MARLRRPRRVSHGGVTRLAVSWGMLALRNETRRHRIVPRRSARWLASLVVLSALTSCGGAEVRWDLDPIVALEAWHQALSEERPHDAWALLAPSAKEGLSEASFVAQFPARQAELVARARELLSYARTHPAAERAVVDAGGHRVHLVRTHDGWRVLEVIRGVPSASPGANSE